MFASWLADLRYASRRLRTQPGYALLAVLTLALGVGGTAATYGVARGVLFEALPYPHEREVGCLLEEDRLDRRGVSLHPWPRPRVRSGGALPAARRHPARRRRAGASRARRRRPPPSSSTCSGRARCMGRGFAALDDVPGAEPVAILSFSLWRELGGDPSIIGTRHHGRRGPPHRDRRDAAAASGSRIPSVRIWTPAALTAEGRSWNSTLVGRVAPGQDVRAMATPVAQLVAMLDERFDYPGAMGQDARTRTSRRCATTSRGAMRPALLATLGGDGADPVDRVRERRRADAGASRRAVGGARGPLGARRQPAATDAVAHRRGAC